MSETLFKFLLSEVQAVRVTCQRLQNGRPCGASVEVPLNQLGKVRVCPACNNLFIDDVHNSTFDAFSRIVEGMVGLKKSAAKVELVLPATPSAK